MHKLIEVDSRQVHHAHLEEMNFHRYKWLDVENPSDQELKKICDLVKVPKHDLKRYFDRDELPRVSKLDHFDTIIFKCPAHVESRSLSTTSVAFLVSERLIITLHKDHVEGLAQLKKIDQEELRKLLNQGCHKFLYNAIEYLTNQFFTSLDEIEEQINKIEDTVFSHPEQKTVKKIFSLKRTLIYFHKGLSANRDVLISIQKDEVIIKGALKKKFNKLYYDCIQLIDVVATYRDILTGALDIYLSAVSNNMNAVMKKMAAYGTLVLVPTFITGLYGMNFRFMPELNWYYGYFFAWSVIIISVVILTTYFKKNDWF